MKDTIEIDIVTQVSLAATKAAHAAYAGAIMRSLAMRVDPEFAIEDATDQAAEAAHKLAAEFGVTGAFSERDLSFVVEE